MKAFKKTIVIYGKSEDAVSEASERAVNAARADFVSTHHPVVAYGLGGAKEVDLKDDKEGDCVLSYWEENLDNEAQDLVRKNRIRTALLRYLRIKRK